MQDVDIGRLLKERGSSELMLSHGKEEVKCFLCELGGLPPHNCGKTGVWRSDGHVVLLSVKCFPVLALWQCVQRRGNHITNILKQHQL